MGFLPRHENRRICSAASRIAAVMAVFALGVLPAAFAVPQNPVATQSPRPAFNSIWAYLMRG